MEVAASQRPQLHHEVEAAVSVEVAFAQTPKIQFRISIYNQPIPQHTSHDSRRLIVAMAEASGVTETSLKTKITELLQATHVEIEDVSGTFPAPLCPSIQHELSN
jgi:hypothetical protein